MRRDKREKEREKAANARLRHMYVTERNEERAARFCGLVHPGAAGGRKMQAFMDSAFRAARL